MKSNWLSSICMFAITFTIITKCDGFAYDICDASQLKGSMNWLNVSDCDPKLVDRCSFKKGTNVTLSTSFTSNEGVNGLKVKIFGSVLGISVPWKVTPDDACVHGVRCPVTAGTQNHFVLSMPISTNYPTIPVTVKVRLEDSRRQPYYCVQFPAKISN